MGKIGSFGGVTFKVSSDKVLTFNGLSRSGSSRWAVHDVNQNKPIPEFIGPGQETLSYSIHLNAFHGVSPEAEMKKLRTFKDKGKVGSFIIGTKPITSGYWYIDDISESYKHVDGKGRVLTIDATLTIKEYPKPVVIKKEKPKSKAKTKKPAASKKKTTGTITIKVGMLNCRATPSLKGKIVKVLRKNQKFKVYGTKKTDITWYDLGGGQYTSAVSKYTSFKEG